MEKSHQRTIMDMRRTHRQELDRVRQDMDLQLKEEADATQAGFTLLSFQFRFQRYAAFTPAQLVARNKLRATRNLLRWCKRGISRSHIQIDANCL